MSDTPPGGAPPPPPPPPAPTVDSTTRLPDDHPLVTAFERTKADLATARKAQQELDDAGKSELQKAQEALAEKDQALADLPGTVRRQVLGFATAASAAGFIDPEDALVGMPDDVDLSDRDAVKAALEELAVRKPHLVRKAKGPNRPRPAKDETGGDGDDDPPKGKAGAAAALRGLRGGG